MWTVGLGALGGVSASLANQVLVTAQAAVDYWSRYVDSAQASLDVEISFVSFGDGTLAQGGTDFFSITPPAGSITSRRAPSSNCRRASIQTAPPRTFKLKSIQSH